MTSSSDVARCKVRNIVEFKELAILSFRDCPNILSIVRHASGDETDTISCTPKEKNAKEVKYYIHRQAIIYGKLSDSSSTCSGLRTFVFLKVSKEDPFKKENSAIFENGSETTEEITSFWLVVDVCATYREGFLMPFSAFAGDSFPVIKNEKKETDFVS